jgi:hypothetical protein
MRSVNMTPDVALVPRRADFPTVHGVGTREWKQRDAL